MSHQNTVQPTLCTQERGPEVFPHLSRKYDKTETPPAPLRCATSWLHTFGLTFPFYLNYTWKWTFWQKWLFCRKPYIYTYNYLFLQILIISFCITINQLKKCASFWHNAGVIRVNHCNLKQLKNGTLQDTGQDQYNRLGLEPDTKSINQLLISCQWTETILCIVGCSDFRKHFGRMSCCAKLL